MVAALAGRDGLEESFLMERIQPPAHDTVFLRGGVAEAGRGVPELGIYAVFLGDGERVELCEYAGYLVRTKPASALDGGVCSGVASLDSVELTGGGDGKT
eukprot:gene3287-21_t